MTLSAVDKIKLIKENLEKVDIFSAKFDSQIQNIKNKHKTKGGHIEYAYIGHFHDEIIGLSKLFQYLLENKTNKKYVFFPVRASIEILLYSEYVFNIAKLDDKQVLSLLSKDMAQSVASINSAAPADNNHPMHVTIKKIAIVNKLLKTNFDLTKIKSNTRVFPNIRTLCEQSHLNLKDSYGADIYHIYAMYSESNHLRLGSPYSTSNDIDNDICWALEYFIEIYIKFYEQILNTDMFSEEYTKDLNLIKQSLGLT